ncbi:MAG: hypothetical protein ABI430_05025 [Candidatus Taylorbacteria bacterium]
MKKLLVMALLVAGIANSFGAVASKVKFYSLWVSLPDANRATNSFPVARDNLMSGLKLGGVFDPRGRENSPTGLDFVQCFDAGDVATTTGTNTLWRFEFNPSGQFTNNFGNRGYCPVIVVGIDGQVSIDRLSWKVYGGPLSGIRDLKGISYFPSTRVGVNAGPDGRLWTADDQFVSSGPGTQLVDAVAYIGASLTSPNVDSIVDQTKLNNDLAGGLPVTVEYKFDGLNGDKFHPVSTLVYPSGGVPEKKYGFRKIETPYGFLWSLMAPKGSTWTVGKSPVVNGFYNPETVTAGFSIPAFFNQNPMMFYRVQRIE